MSEVSLGPVVIEKDGEMPESAVVKSASSTPRNISTPSRGTPPPPPQISSFPQYNVPDDPRTSTPEPILVTRSKKKKTGTGRKKRTQVSSEQS